MDGVSFIGGVREKNWVLLGRCEGKRTINLECLLYVAIFTPNPSLTLATKSILVNVEETPALALGVGVL